MAYKKEQLSLCQGTRIPDLIGEECKLLFVGINQGLQTAMAGIHFAHPSNRFWPALRKAGIIDWVSELSPVAPSVGIDVYDEPWTARTQNRLRTPDLSHRGRSNLIDPVGLSAKRVLVPCTGDNNRRAHGLAIWPPCPFTVDACAATRQRRRRKESYHKTTDSGQSVGHGGQCSWARDTG